MKPQTILGIDAAWTASEGSGVALLSATEKIAGAQPTVIHRQYTRNRGGLSTGFTIALLKKAPLILMGLVTVVALGIAACASSSETTATFTTQQEGPQTTAGPAATTATTEALTATTQATTTTEAAPATGSPAEVEAVKEAVRSYSAAFRRGHAKEAWLMRTPAAQSRDSYAEFAGDTMRT